jgi:fucose 4-O-acetylase-like acetyltransferase
VNLTVFVTFWLIVLARITDVSLDTIRTVSVVQGRRVFAAVLGFFEAVVYVCAVAKVLLNMNQPVYALAYGLGFALGTYLGMVIEQIPARVRLVTSVATICKHSLSAHASFEGTASIGSHPACAGAATASVARECWRTSGAIRRITGGMDTFN